MKKLIAELTAEVERLREALRDNWCYEKTELDRILEDSNDE